MPSWRTNQLSFRLGVLVPATLLLISCNSLLQSHGEVVRSPEDPIEVVLPENAPSIWRNFRDYPTERRHKQLPEEHIGIDIIGRSGLVVIAAVAGTVIASYFEPAYGNRVEIDHGDNEQGMRITSKYFHLKKRLVETGAGVTRGQPVGELGMTGLLALGLTHLHFEVHTVLRQGQLDPVDPHLYWFGGEGQVTCFDGAIHWPATPRKMTYPVVCRQPAP